MLPVFVAFISFHLNIGPCMKLACSSRNYSAHISPLLCLISADAVKPILSDLDLPSKCWIVMPINDNESLDHSGGSHW